METPKVLFRGTTQNGFEMDLKASRHLYQREGLYLPWRAFTTHWPNALAYAMQYAVEYSSTGLVIILLEPRRYKLELQDRFNPEHYLVLDTVDLNEGKTLVLREGIDLERLCEFLVSAGTQYEPQQVLDSVSQARERFSDKSCRLK